MVVKGGAWRRCGGYRELKRSRKGWGLLIYVWVKFGGSPENIPARWSPESAGVDGIFKETGGWVRERECK